MEKGQYEASAALGLSKSQTFFRIILYFICVFITYFISNSVPYSLLCLEIVFLR